MLGGFTRMKKCTYCGKEYPDEAEICVTDHEPLQTDPPTSSADSSDTPISADALEVPDDYICLGHFDPFDAARLLQEFESDGIRFLIERVEKSVEAGRGIRKQNFVEIDVHHEDEKRASAILTRDWKI
jgi:hypothetical protein